MTLLQFGRYGNLPYHMRRYKGATPLHSRRFFNRVRNTIPTYWMNVLSLVPGVPPYRGARRRAGPILPPE